MSTVFELLAASLLVIGGLFAVIGSWGLLRLKDPMQRLHAPTKASTIGVGSALFASAFDLWQLEGRLTAQEILVALFLFVTAPLAALMMARVAMASLPHPPLPPSASGPDGPEPAPPADPATSAPR